MVSARIVLAMTVVCSWPLATTWPAVQPFHQERVISREDPTSDVPWLFRIPAQGDVVYRVECHTGEYEGPSLFNINYSGTYQCVMFAARGQAVTSWNLFADSTPDEHASDWNNRGRMLTDNLRGACADYPEYGAVRHFRVRGMVLTMRFKDLAWSSTSADSRLTQFTLEIDVKPDVSAQSPSSEHLDIAKPPPSCRGMRQ